MEGALLQAKIETGVSLAPMVDHMTEALPPKSLDHPPAPSTKTRTEVSIVTNTDTFHGRTSKRAPGHTTERP